MIYPLIQIISHWKSMKRNRNLWYLHHSLYQFQPQVTDTRGKKKKKKLNAHTHTHTHEQAWCEIIIHDTCMVHTINSSYRSSTGWEQNICDSQKEDNPATIGSTCLQSSWPWIQRSTQVTHCHSKFILATTRINIIQNIDKTQSAHSHDKTQSAHSQSQLTSLAN